MSHPSCDKEKGLQPDATTLTSPVLDAEGENQIRARFGRYRLGKLFGAGGVLYSTDPADNG